MQRIFLCVLIVLAACKGDKKAEENEEGFTYNKFSEAFKTASVPFQLSDTFFLKNKDTATIKEANFSSFVPDSIKNKIFGKGSKVKYVPLYKIEAPKAESYFVVKAMSNKTKAALLFVFNTEGQFDAVFPFLIPDNDDATSQSSSIDKSYSVSRNVTLKRSNDLNAEGKDVYAYSKEAKQFVLIMTDPLDERSIDLVNPIDTLSKQHKFAGDYSKNKRNIVSVRDGRKPNLLTVFVHIEQKEGTCTGELKGDAEITSATTAVFRQPGDPCILQLTFSSSSVKLSEVEGCGSKRGLECAFDGSFSKKKAPKASAKKSSAKS